MGQDERYQLPASRMEATTKELRSRGALLSGWTAVCGLDPSTYGSRGSRQVVGSRPNDALSGTKRTSSEPRQTRDRMLSAKVPAAVLLRCLYTNRGSPRWWRWRSSLVFQVTFVCWFAG